MGLTISWRIGTDDDITAALGKLTALRELAGKLPFKELSGVEFFDAKDVKKHLANKDSDWRWTMGHAGRFIDYAMHYQYPGGGYKPKLLTDEEREQGHNYSMMQLPTRVMGFRFWPGEGCQSACMVLCQYPKTFLISTQSEWNQLAARLRTPSKFRWSGKAFCKTVYSAEPVKCHLLVIALLDAAVKVGLDVVVNDEGDYWTKRDVNALARELDDDRSSLAALVGALKDTVGGNFVAPIMQCPDFERLEAKGVVTSELRQLIDVIKAVAPAAAQPMDN
jgi:hypothetical protein